MVIAPDGTRTKRVGQVFNVGSDEPIAILDAGQTRGRGRRSVAPHRVSVVPDAYSGDFEDVRIRVPCLDKLRQTIHYAPQYDLDAIIREVIEWERGSEISD